MFEFDEEKMTFYDLTEKQKSELKIFNPEDSITIIINELKQLNKLENIHLDMTDNNIYNFKLVYYSNICLQFVRLNHIYGYLDPS